MSTCKIASIPLAASASILVPVLLGGAAAIVTAAVVAHFAKAHQEAMRSAIRAKDLAGRREQAQEKQRNEDATRSAADKMAALREFQNTAASSGLTSQRSRLDADAAATGPDSSPPQEGAQAAESLQLLSQIRQELQALPPAALQDPERPFQRLMVRIERVEQAAKQGKPVDMEDILGLQEASRRSIARHAPTAASGKVDALSQEIEALYLQATSLALAGASEAQTLQAEALRRQILTLAGVHDLAPGALDALRQALETLRSEVETALTWREFRRTLTNSVQRHMADMGYHNIAAFRLDEKQALLSAVFKAPGGERVSSSIENDGRMVFTLSHERAESSSHLSEEETAFYRRQEFKWSLDFQELLRRLTAEGFSYGLQLEQCVANDAIPIVVVETGQELEEQERTRAPLQRQAPHY